MISLLDRNYLFLLPDGLTCLGKVSTSTTDSVRKEKSLPTGLILTSRVRELGLLLI